MSLMLPKPQKKKKCKPKNNPKPTEDDKCIVCGVGYAELHEPIMGYNRQNSIKYNLNVRLCPLHHRIGEDSAHKNANFNKKLQAMMQEKFEKENPNLDFYTIFGKYYKY